MTGREQQDDSRPVGGGQMKKPRGKRSQKVKSFLKSWLEQSIEGTKTSLWLKPDPANSLRAVCTVCPAVTSFSINEGWKAIIQHNNGKQHKGKTFRMPNKPRVPSKEECYATNI